jgi:hypothetical protein
LSSIVIVEAVEGNRTLVFDLEVGHCMSDTRGIGPEHRTFWDFASIIGMRRGYLWAALHSLIMSNLFMRSDGVLERGIAYYARHDDEALCYAIFDRARSAIKEVKREINLDKSWFWKLAQRYKVGMAPK